MEEFLRLMKESEKGRPLDQPKPAKLSTKEDGFDRFYKRLLVSIEEACLPYKDK